MNRAVLLVMIQFALFGLMALALVALPASQGRVLRATGFVLMFAGPLVALAAIAEHGRRNATPPRIVPTPNERVPLIETGLYTRIRHPIYTGVLLTGLGATLAHGHPGLLAIEAILVIFFTVKARYEEALLQRAYPTYDAYMHRTGRFLPPLRR